MSMPRLFRFTFRVLCLGLIIFQSFAVPLAARAATDSIDSCLFRKEYFFNEVHNIWVKNLARCSYNTKGVLSKATAQGISTLPADEQACAGKSSGQILIQGTPSEEEARRWSESCSYLGTVGGAGPITTSNNTSNLSRYTGLTSNNFGTTGSSSRSTTSGQTTTTTRQPTADELADMAIDLENEGFQAGTSDYNAERTRRIRALSGTGSTDFTPVYTGLGVQVPDEDLIPGGISKKKSLGDLIIFYTNATLPYVSVISIFAFVAAGLFYILSFTNEELNAKAKNIMTYVVIGIVIIFSAYTIVNTLLSFIKSE